MCSVCGSHVTNFVRSRQRQSQERHGVRECTREGLWAFARISPAASRSDLCSRVLVYSVFVFVVTQYLALRTWSVPSPKYLVRLQRAADTGPRTTDGLSTKYLVQSTACYTKTTALQPPTVLFSCHDFGNGRPVVTEGDAQAMDRTRDRRVPASARADQLQSIWKHPGPTSGIPTTIGARVIPWRGVVRARSVSGRGDGRPHAGPSCRQE